MSVPMKKDDPAYWMLEEGLADPSKRSVQTAPRRSNCYICRDPEFSLMGLPLCYACEKCGGHVAADDTVCNDCGHDQMDLLPTWNGWLRMWCEIGQQAQPPYEYPEHLCVDGKAVVFS